MKYAYTIFRYELSCVFNSSVFVAACPESHKTLQDRQFQQLEEDSKKLHEDLGTLCFEPHLDVSLLGGFAQHLCTGHAGSSDLPCFSGRAVTIRDRFVISCHLTFRTTRELHSTITLRSVQQLSAASLIHDKRYRSDGLAKAASLSVKVACRNSQVRQSIM